MIPNVVSLKWSTPDTGTMTFEQIVSRFSDRFAIIDNQMRYVTSHILGARSIEVHVANYWPQWGVDLWQMLERGEYAEAQREMVTGRACRSWPCGPRWRRYTGGDGYLDKLCMELVGLPRAAPGRPPATCGRCSARRRARCSWTAACPASSG